MEIIQNTTVNTDYPDVTILKVYITELENQVADLKKQLEKKENLDGEARFRNVFESANVGKSLTLVSGEMYVNQAFSDMLGYNREELQMKSWKDITPAEDIAPIEKLIKDTYSVPNDKGIRIIKRYIKKDGSYIWTDVSGKLIRDEHGIGLYHIATIIDITDRVKAEEALECLNNELESKVKERTFELETLNKELQAFNYSVSHDLRTPLRILRTYASILTQDYAKKLDNNGQKYLQNIHKSADRMDKLITDLLNLSQVTRSEINPELVNMNELAESVFYELATEEERNSFDIKIESLPVAWCDPSLIRQVWQNLIGNALKYSSKADTKKIELYASEDKNGITYFIKDYGAGFDINFSKKLFTAFQRLHNSEDFPGSGIGLAVVHQIVKRHGGSVNAESTLGEGATFSFTLNKKKTIKTHKKSVSKYPEN